MNNNIKSNYNTHIKVYILGFIVFKYGYVIERILLYSKKIENIIV